MKNHDFVTVVVTALLSASAVFAAPPEPGNQFFLDLGDGQKLDMVWIPAGEFMMGSTDKERKWAAGKEGKGKADLESGEPRKVSIAKGFWMSRTEVTVAQWKAFAVKNGFKTEAEKQGSAITFRWGDNMDWSSVKGANYQNLNFGFPVLPEHPATCVTWSDAVAFCGWLNSKEPKDVPGGYEYRLPAEEEWEYACRAGTDTMFWWGDDPNDAEGRENLCSKDPLGHELGDEVWPAADSVSFSDGYAWISPVGVFGQKGRNPFGLSDMLGNVKEFCIEGVSTGGHDYKMLRGGDFYSPPGRARSASRSRDFSKTAASRYGFRVCLGPPRK
jgi:formylglycine-generating enzyme required for sulfatase activity